MLRDSCIRKYDQRHSIVWVSDIFEDKYNYEFCGLYLANKQEIRDNLHLYDDELKAFRGGDPHVPIFLFFCFLNVNFLNVKQENILLLAEKIIIYSGVVEKEEKPSFRGRLLAPSQRGVQQRSSTKNVERASTKNVEPAPCLCYTLGVHSKQHTYTTLTRTSKYSLTSGNYVVLL